MIKWLERWAGLDDAVERQARAPLWKRAAWRAAKHLVRKHPRAAISAAGAGAGYAVTQATEEGAEAVKDSVKSGVELIKKKVNRDRGKPELQIEHPKPRNERSVMKQAELTAANEGPANHASPHTDQLTEEEKRQLVESLSPGDRRALADLAKKP